MLAPDVLQATLDPVLEAHASVLGMVQLRCSAGWDAAATRGINVVQLAHVLHRACETHEVLSCVNGNGARVAQSDARALHLGTKTLSPAAVRAQRPEVLLGFSAHSVEELCRVAPSVDYATLSPIFAPVSKHDTRLQLGESAVRASCARNDLPIIALGGITPANALACLNAGAAGVAGIGRMLGARDPVSAISEFREALGL